VPIKLECREVRLRTDRRRRYILPVIVLPGTRLPVKTKIVFKVVLNQKVFLEIERLREVIAGQLYQRLPYFLRFPRRVLLLIEKQNSLIRVHQELPRMAKAREACPGDNHVVIGHDLFIVDVPPAGLAFRELESLVDRDTREPLLQTAWPADFDRV